MQLNFVITECMINIIVQCIQFIKESLVKEEVNSFFSGKEREHTRFTGNDLQKVVHTDLHSLARKDEIWDVMAEAFGDFFLCCC